MLPLCQDQWTVTTSMEEKRVFLAHILSHYVPTSVHREGSYAALHVGTPAK